LVHIPPLKSTQMLFKTLQYNPPTDIESFLRLWKEMRGGWPDQLLGEDSRYLPISLQASKDVSNPRNSLLNINVREGNNKITILYHWMDQQCWGGEQEGWITAQTYQGILQPIKGKLILHQG
jgi:hypothetical protein